jgi:hypothetical protein
MAGKRRNVALVADDGLTSLSALAATLLQRQGARPRCGRPISGEDRVFSTDGLWGLTNKPR